MDRLTWLAFILFTSLHLFANFKAVTSVQMETFNRTRFLLLLKQYASNMKILSVKEVNRLEPVIFGLIPRGHFFHQEINSKNFILIFFFTKINTFADTR
jgi:Vitamin B6 photo-protection and homoeostasis